MASSLTNQCSRTCLQAVSEDSRRPVRAWLGIGFAVLVLLAGCSSVPPTGPGEAGTPQERLRAHLDLAEGYLETGDLNRAKRPLDRAEQINSRSWEVQSLRARIYQLEGDPENAERHFRLAVRYGGNESRVRNDYGVFLYQQGNYEEAVNQLTRAVEDSGNPQRAVAYENLGLASLRVGARTEARNAFNRATMLRERMPVALLELAEMAFDDSDFAQASTYYDRFRAMTRQTPRSLWLGIRLARVFDNADAESSFALQLRNLYPSSTQYLEYRESVHGG